MVKVNSVSGPDNAVSVIDCDLFMEGATQEGGSRPLVGEQEGKS